MKNLTEIKNGIMALNLDQRSLTENIIVGDYDNVSLYLLTGKAKDIEISARPFGSLLKDISVPSDESFGDIYIKTRSGLVNKGSSFIGEKKTELEEMFKSDNYCHKFFAMRFWEEYETLKNGSKDGQRLFFKAKNEGEEKLKNSLERLLYPLRTSLIAEIYKIQRENPKNPLACLNREYFMYQATITFSNLERKEEFIITDYSIIPLIVYYLKKIYDEGLYLHLCKLCGEPAFSKVYSKPAFCSDKCRQVQVRRNKEKYESQNKNSPEEKSYKNAYMYWYNRLEKAKSRKGISLKSIKRLEKAFEDFLSEALTMKKNVKKDNSMQKSFEEWLNNERKTIDKLLKEEFDT